MKKFLIMTFVSVAMLAAVSCSKDDEKETPSLVGTEWECNETISTTVMSIPVSGSMTADLVFTTETSCNFSGNVNVAGLIERDIPAGERPYSFDGKKVRFAVPEMSSLLGSDELVLDYNDNLRTLSYALPSSVASMLGKDAIVFHRTK